MTPPYTLLVPEPNQWIPPWALDPTGGSVGDLIQLVDIGGGVLRWMRVAAGTGGKVGIPYVIDGGGLALITGAKAGFVRIPFAGEIVGWSLYGDGNSGSIVIDTWKDTHANFPPTVADSIWGGAKLTCDGAT